MPLVLMTYYNPGSSVRAQGVRADGVDAGVDGVIVVDLPPEESGPLRAEAAAAAGLDLIHAGGADLDARRGCA